MKRCTLKKKSSSQTKKEYEVEKIKRTLPPYCVICGRYHGDAAHLVPRSLYPEHYTNPENIVILCRSCHNKYDDNREFRKRQKWAIERVKSFDEKAANRYFDL